MQRGGCSNKRGWTRCICSATNVANQPGAFPMRILLPFVVGLLSLPVQVHAAENVPVASFHSVQLVGGGDVDIVPGPVQRVTLLGGSTAYTRFSVERGGKLRIDACNSRCPRNYPLHIRI